MNSAICAECDSVRDRLRNLERLAKQSRKTAKAYAELGEKAIADRFETEARMHDAAAQTLAIRYGVK